MHRRPTVRPRPVPSRPIAAFGAALSLAFTLAAAAAGVVERPAINPGLGPPPPEAHRDNPAATWTSLLDLGATGRFDLAAHLLDLGEIPAAQQRATGATVAERLYRVLASLSARRDAVSEESPEGPRVEGGRAESVLALRFSRAGLRGEVRLRPVESRDRSERAWLFDAPTVSAAAFWYTALVVGVPAQQVEPINPGLGLTPPEVRRGSPREAVGGFLEACEAGRFDVAAHYLDLADVESDRQVAEGARLARRLMIGLLGSARVELDEISDDPLGMPESDVADNEERIATVRRRFRTGEVVLVHRWDPLQGHVWLFSRSTLARLGDLYLSSLAMRFVDHVPTFGFAGGMTGLQVWQWVVLLGALLVGWVVSRFAGRALRRLARAVTRRTRTAWDDVVAESLDGPAAFLVWVLLLAGVVPFLGLFPAAQTIAHRLLLILGVLGLGWTAARLTDGFVDHLRRSAAAEANQVSVGFLPIAARFVKVFLGLLVVLAALRVVGVDVGAGLAGLGLAGAAVAFAAQKTLENLFGATVIAADRPFKVGDFVAIGTDQGTVEDIGLRSTRLRTLGRSVVSVPNGIVAGGRLENFAHRDRFLFNPTVGLVYSTSAAQLREVLAGLTALLAAHPEVSSEGLRVRFRGFGDSALQVELLAWIDTPDFPASLRVAEELNFGILDVVERAGSAFAFPTRTVYLASDGAASSTSASPAATPPAD